MKKMKKYIVIVGNERYRPETRVNAAKKYDTLAEARESARRYELADIYRVDYTCNGWELTQKLKTI
jgi:hypothetical protein